MLSSRFVSLMALAIAIPMLPAALSGTRWPSFRGSVASGVADGQQIPDTWNLSTGEHVV